MKQRQQFLDYLHHERGLSPRTRSAYRRDLSLFFEELDNLDICDLNQVHQHQVRGLVARLHRQGLGSRSLQRLLSAIRSFYRWAMKEGLAEHNPAVPVKAPRAQKKLPATLDTDTVTRLLDIKDDTPLAIRDKAIMELFYSSGLRLSELAGLRWDQIDPHRG